jgi:hypothetical protein
MHHRPTVSVRLCKAKFTDLSCVQCLLLILTHNLITLFSCFKYPCVDPFCVIKSYIPSHSYMSSDEYGCSENVKLYYWWRGVEFVTKNKLLELYTFYWLLLSCGNAKRSDMIPVTAFVRCSKPKLRLKIVALLSNLDFNSKLWGVQSQASSHHSTSTGTVLDHKSCNWQRVCRHMLFRVGHIRGTVKLPSDCK